MCERGHGTPDAWFFIVLFASWTSTQLDLPGFSQLVYFNCSAALTVKSSYKRKIPFLCIFAINWHEIKPFS
jgi:hypothetical protein